MNKSTDVSSKVTDSSLSEKTRTFLWKSANILKEKDAELSRDMIHSMNESSKDADSDFSRATCKKCGTIRDYSNTTHRLKPKEKCSKSVQKAMKRQKIHTTNSKRTNAILKRFVNSTSTLTIRCKFCSFVEEVPTSSRSDICTIRNKEKQRRKTSTSKTATSLGLLRSSTPISKHKSVENFINVSLNSSKSSTPISTPKNRKRRSSHLSQLLSNETYDSPSTSLTDFLMNL